MRYFPYCCSICRSKSLAVLDEVARLEFEEAPPDMPLTPGGRLITSSCDCASGLADRLAGKLFIGLDAPPPGACPWKSRCIN
jgi:hypothetical protein